MNINPINFYSQNQVSSNNKAEVGFIFNQPASDCFIKSKNVSFTALSNAELRQQKVDSFMKDLSTKLNSPKFSISDISSSISKYSKNVKVKPLNQAPKELLFSKSLQGLYSVELTYNSSENKLFIPKQNRNFYVRTETLKEELGNIWVFVNSVHEFTHVLQYDCENATQLGIFNSYIQKNKSDIDEALNQVSVVSATVHALEESIARPFIDTLAQYEELAFNRLQMGKNDMFDWLCRKNKITDFEEYINEKIAVGIKNIEEEQGIQIDKKLFFDIAINNFEKEIEAYQNENKAFKMCLGLDSPRSLTRIQLYKKSIEVMKNIRQE